MSPRQILLVLLFNIKSSLLFRPSLKSNLSKSFFILTIFTQLLTIDFSKPKSFDIFFIFSSDDSHKKVDKNNNILSFNDLF